jgi:hypothetical protein
MSEKLPTIGTSIQEQTPVPKVFVETKYIDYVPQDFLNNPVGYFEHEGKNVKDGEKKVDEDGSVRDDPTAVKDLPVWKNHQGQEVLTVAKRVDTTKGKVGKSGDPFYEYKIMQKVTEIGLPAAKTIAIAEQAGIHLIVMERIPGTRWSELKDLHLLEQGYSSEDIDSLAAQAEEKMELLKVQFEQAGIIRKWKLKDMVLQIDIENKKITAVVPTDWERTKIVDSQ